MTTEPDKLTRDFVDLTDTVMDLADRLADHEARLKALEAKRPESGQNRTVRALAALADRIDARNPDRVPANEVEIAAARARLLAVE